MAESDPIHESRFTIDTSAIKFGAGMTRETGYEVARLGCRRVMVLTDPRVAALPALEREPQAVDGHRDPALE